MIDTSCTCGSGRPVESCCGPYLGGEQTPPTAEALMRSRYSAYVREDIAYLEATSGGKARRTFDRRGVAAWARAARFTGLEILDTDAGGPEDDTGVVEFAATFEERGRVQTLRERSRFVREGGAWRYVGAVRAEPVRSAAKVGRNDPCPCGSTRKYKRCCGR